MTASYIFIAPSSQQLHYGICQSFSPSAVLGHRVIAPAVAQATMFLIMVTSAIAFGASALLGESSDRRIAATSALLAGATTALVGFIRWNLDLW